MGPSLSLPDARVAARRCVASSSQWKHPSNSLGSIVRHPLELSALVSGTHAQRTVGASHDDDDDDDDDDDVEDEDKKDNEEDEEDKFAARRATQGAEHSKRTAAAVSFWPSPGGRMRCESPKE